MERTPRRVPFGVWVVAALAIVLSTLLFLDATGVRPSNSSSIIMTLGAPGGAISWVISGLAVVGVAAAVALVRLLPAGLVAITLLAGLALLNELGSRLTGQADDLRLAVLVVMVLYLNQPAVREAFGQDDSGARTPTMRGAEGE